jgi:hypothetical protein
MVCVWLSAGVAWGHLPKGEPIRAFQFPDELVPTIDGDLSDWDIVGATYLLDQDDFSDLVSGEGAERDLKDFALQAKVGWNASRNQLYISARIVDDRHQIDRPAGSAGLLIFQDDDMEVFLDADHSGGQYADFSDLSSEEQLLQNGASASHFIMAAPPPDGEFFVNFSAASWYALPDGRFTKAAFSLDGAVGGATVMHYEMLLVPFDHINMGASFLSTPHVMQENQVMGFNLEFNDFDAFSDVLDAKWSLSGGQNSFKFSQRFADLLLMPFENPPTVVAPSSWGSIKASFRYNN